MKLKSVFFGTPEFAIPTLNALAELTDLRLVVTQEDKRKGRGKKLLPTPVKERAQALNIPVYQPENINTPEALQRLRDEDPDLFIVVAYGQILKKEFLEIPKRYIMNVHSSLLPRHRGAAPMQWAILAGDEKTGVSFMQIEEGLDSGPVYDTRSIEIGDKNFGEVHDLLADMGADLLKQFIQDMESGEITLNEQDDSLATYAPKIDDDLLAIDARGLTAEVALRKVRAFSPEPGAHFMMQGERLKIYEAERSDEDLAPGEFKSTKKKLFIGMKEGSLSIKELQRPGKKRMPVGSYLAGAHLPERGEV